MDQEKIGKIIKQIRKENKLSQTEFAKKYGVTYQAVSKWENGKNIPDITILTSICKDYNLKIEDLLDAKICKEEKFNKLNIIIPIVIIILLICIVITINIKNNDFEFKVLSTTCNDFNLYGSIAYNDNKSSIHISNITYCGIDDDKEYQSINCTLYETNNNTKIEISKYNYEEEQPITLEKFLKFVDFNIADYSQKCKSYTEHSLQLEIEATDSEGKITTYKIPIKLDDNCTN